MNLFSSFFNENSLLEIFEQKVKEKNIIYIPSTIKII